MNFMTIAYIVAALLGLAGLRTLCELIYYLSHGERYFGRLRRVPEILIMIPPLVLSIGDIGMSNDCCSDSALFSPSHRLSVIVLILLCLSAYFYSAFRKKLAAPVIEVIINCLLIAGLLCDIVVAMQMKDWIFWVFGNLPIAFQFILVMADNHHLALESLEAQEKKDDGWPIAICRKIVFLHPVRKFPLLLLLCLPVLTLLVCILLLFGQKPDSLIRAFTDTYKHGFSQLDYQCAGVGCGGHFLCTIAAKGHRGLVRPIRMGIRGGKPIRCNRQLLVSNAFEELLEQRAPWLHRPIRRLYNRIGDFLHRYYGAFNHAWVSDCIYILMKPLEWIFVLVLYMADRNPETRIAQQYMHPEYRQELLRQSGPERPAKRDA